MPVQLDCFIVPSHNRVASAQLLADILGVTWEKTASRRFSCVYLDGGLTLRFIQTDEDYLPHRYCFRASWEEFAAIVARIRAAGVEFRSEPDAGGTLISWDAPDGHQWQLMCA